MRRTSCIYNDVDYFILGDLQWYLSEKPYKSSSQFWEDSDAFRKGRRHTLLRCMMAIELRHIKMRFLKPRFLLLKLLTFTIKNKRNTSLFRKYISNRDIHSTTISNALRSSNLMLWKSVFYDFLNTKNIDYLWCNSFSKKKYFFKKFSYNEHSVFSKKGADLFIFGNIDFSIEEGFANLFLLSDYNLFFRQDLELEHNPLITFDLCIQIILEFYKAIQILFLNMCLFTIR